MKRTLLLLMSVLLYAASAWAYSTTKVTEAKDSKGNALVSGGFYRILLPSRGANVALKTADNVYVQAYNGLGGRLRKTPMARHLSLPQPVVIGNSQNTLPVTQS